VEAFIRGEDNETLVGTQGPTGKKPAREKAGAAAK
jgi:hypothetical protein